MTTNSNIKFQPYVPFLHEMAISFFEAARTDLDPVLEDLDGYRELGTDQDGTPTPPNHVAQKFAELPMNIAFRHVGKCLSATTNLGLAYVHSFRLLSFLSQNKDGLPPKASSPNLVKLFDVLPTALQESISNLYSQIGAHDFELEVSAEKFSEEAGDEKQVKGRDFRSKLLYWQSHRMLQDSHLSLSSTSRLRIFIPLRTMLVLDSIIAELIAPKLGVDYKTMDAQMSSSTENPKLEWDDGMIKVSLPDKLGRTLEASWIPAVTSVIRIREAGTTTWSPGFETPFNQCSFVDLRPDTEYELQVTHKNDAGESEPAISTIKTGSRLA